MRVLILGGSNSIKREGWVAKLRAALPEAQIDNLSVGASNSLMGYFRLSAATDLHPGDAVVWEYALNDENQIEVDKPLDVEKALKYAELTVLLAIERRLRFLPVIFRPRRFARRAVVSAYRAGLIAMFARYGVTPVDPYALYAEAHGGAEVPAEDYEDRVHLREDGNTVRLAAMDCAARLKSLQPLSTPVSADGEGAEAGQVRAVTGFDGAAPVIFENSLMRQQVWQPGPQSLAIHRPEQGRWRIVAVFSVAGKERAHFVLRAGEVTQAYSAFHKNPEFSKPLMRMHDTDGRRPLIVGPKRPLELVGWDATGPALPPGIAGGPLPGQTGLAGLLLERV